LVKKSKIPVRIDWIKDDSGKYETQIVMDSTDFFSSDTKIREKILKFKIKYIENVKKVQKIFYGKNFDEKKYRDLSSLTYFKIGLILKKFNKHIQNEFEITNYNQAISRDFGLSPDYISDIITIAEVFKKNEIMDSIPFSYYRALKRKRIELIELGLFEKEKKRLNKMANDEKLLGRENYKKELNVLLTSNNKKRKQK
tara:strand:+ start:1623 stop:2216 length:594 start_codon:yes stop_codon:yes gene_type:complete